MTIILIISIIIVVVVVAFLGGKGGMRVHCPLASGFPVRRFSWRMPRCSKETRKASDSCGFFLRWTRSRRALKIPQMPSGLLMGKRASNFCLGWFRHIAQDPPPIGSSPNPLFGRLSQKGGTVELGDAQNWFLLAFLLKIPTNQKRRFPKFEKLPLQRVAQRNTWPRHVLFAELCPARLRHLSVIQADEVLYTRANLDGTIPNVRKRDND